MFFRTWVLGVKSLLLHPMRSILTMIGIMFGVAAVIWLLAIGSGISQKAQEQIEQLGAENIIVRSIKPPQSTTSFSRASELYGITRSERELMLTIPTVEEAIPVRELKTKITYTGNPNSVPIDGRLVGCTPEYQAMNRLEVDRGHFLTHPERTSTVCVISAEIALKLFPYEDPLRKNIFLPAKNQRYEIVGVLKHRMPTAAIGGSFAAQDFSKDVYIPIDTMRSRIGDTEEQRGAGFFSSEYFELTQVTIRVGDVEDVEKTADVVRNTLMRNDERREDFGITVPYELLERAKATGMMFQVFLLVIAAISLLVGGIGIMNIMLATVTERTREIGIRRALGGCRRDIIRQFLVETVVLSTLGGVLGIILGALCRPSVTAIRAFARRFFAETYASLPPEIAQADPSIVPASIPLAFGISVAVGVIFGLYPAMRAAQMDPIEALRHE